MFDTILGLPLHPLVIHVVVVFVPLAALATIGYAVLPRRRAQLRWPTLGLALVAGVAAAVADRSGEALQVRVFQSLNSASPTFGQTVAQINTHVTDGKLTAKIAVALFVVVAVATLWSLTPTPPSFLTSFATSRFVSVTSVIVLLAAATAALVMVVVAGHTGATAVWSHLVG